MLLSSSSSSSSSFIVNCDCHLLLLSFLYEIVNYIKKKCVCNKSIRKILCKIQYFICHAFSLALSSVFPHQTLGGRGLRINEKKQVNAVIHPSQISFFPTVAHTVDVNLTPTVCGWFINIINQAVLLPPPLVYDPVAVTLFLLLFQYY